MTELAQVPVTALKGVGDALAEKLAKVGLETLQDVLFHLPLRYQDRTRITPIGALRPGQDAVVEGVASQQAGTRMVNEIKIGFAAYAGEQNLARFDELFLKKGRSYSYVVIPSGAGVRTIAAMNGLDSIK